MASFAGSAPEASEGSISAILPATAARRFATSKDTRFARYFRSNAPVSDRSATLDSTWSALFSESFWSSVRWTTP